MKEENEDAGGGMCVLSGVGLSDPMDCSLPGSSVLRILQVGMLQRVAISSSRKSNSTSLAFPALAGGFFITVPLGSP